MIRCGFFNSVNEDRKYNAEDMGKIFEGIISDGVFHNIGNNFKIEKINNTMNINILTGKAWFYGKYFEITSTETKSLRVGDLTDRIDAICIKLDNNNSVRMGSLHIEEGQANQNPTKPVPTNTDNIKFIVIGYVRVRANSQNLNNAIITSNIGTNSCPWSETTLDPRHGMYIYDGESGVEPSLLDTIQGSFEIELAANTSVDPYLLDGSRYTFMAGGSLKSLIDDSIDFSKYHIFFTPRTTRPCRKTNSSDPNFSIQGYTYTGIVDGSGTDAVINIDGYGMYGSMPGEHGEIFHYYKINVDYLLIKKEDNENE